MHWARLGKPAHLLQQEPVHWALGQPGHLLQWEPVHLDTSSAREPLRWKLGKLDMCCNRPGKHCKRNLDTWQTSAPAANGTCALDACKPRHLLQTEPVRWTLANLGTCCNRNLKFACALDTWQNLGTCCKRNLCADTCPTSAPAATGNCVGSNENLVGYPPQPGREAPGWLPMETWPCDETLGRAPTCPAKDAQKTTHTTCHPATEQQMRTKCQEPDP